MTSQPGLACMSSIKRQRNSHALERNSHALERNSHALERNSHALDRGARSVSAIERLPQDMLEAVLGRLGQETLCTARLVSKPFCAAASANIPSLTLKSPSKTVSLERFSRLQHVKVHHTGDDDTTLAQLDPRLQHVKVHHTGDDDTTLAQLDPRLRAVITHVTYFVGPDKVCSGPNSVSYSHASVTLPELPGMRKLRELQINDWGYLVDGATVLHGLTTLGALKIGDCSPSIAKAITAMPWLTSLVIGRVRRPGEGWTSSDFSWLQAATALSQLQALELGVPHEALPLICGLTGLTWVANGMKDTDSIAPLSRLSRLRSLDIHPAISESNLALACSLGSGSLASLRVGVAESAAADCGRLLARQTALTRLGVWGDQLCNLRHMGALRMGALQSLDLRGRAMDAEGLDVLAKATSLTHLGIDPCVEQPGLDLRRSLGRLTQLRSLSLDLDGEIPNLSLAFASLTALTKLQIGGGELENRDVRALVGCCTGLQVIELEKCYLSEDMVPELALLTNLKTLDFYKCGVYTLDPATNILNPLRKARGWPPVHASPCGPHPDDASP